MALSKDVVIKLLGDSKSAEQAFKAAADAAEVSVSAYRKAERQYAAQQAAMEKSAAAQREAMGSVGKVAVTAGAVIAAGLALSTKAAMDWESAWAGVSKTVSGTPAEMNDLEQSLRGLATTLPATHEEIAGVAEAAGQLGIARGDIVEFTKTAIALGVSTNLSAEDAATGLARLSNIMGTSSKDVDRMGATLVALGNAGASTESEILDMALRLGAAGRQAHMSEGDVMGLANSMSSLGIEAEAGGTAMSTVIKDINSAVLDGGDQLEAYAEVAGMSASQFATAWRTDAAGALTTVIEGLGRMQAQGENVNAVIDDLGLGGIRTSDTLLRLAGDSDGLTDSLSTGNQAWAQNSALVAEANKRYETTASKVQIAQNSLNDAAISIGSTLLPMLASGASLVEDFTRGWSDLPPHLQETVVVLGGVAAVIGVVGGAALIAGPKLLAFRAAMSELSTAAGASGAAKALGGFGTFMTGPWGAAITVATVALGGLITWLGHSSNAADDAAGSQSNLAQALRETKGAIDDTARAGALKDLQDKGLDKFAKTWGIALSDMIDASLGVPEAMDRVKAAVEAGKATLSGEWAPAAAAGMDQAVASLQTLAGVTAASVDDQQAAAAAISASGKAAESSSTTMDSLTTSTSGVAGSADEATTAAEGLAKALDDLNGPTLDLREATRDYQDQIDSITAAMGEDGWRATLDNTTEAGRKNQAMLDDLAKSAMQQANAIAANGGSYDAFSNSLNTSRDQLVRSAMAMGATEQQAWDLADSILQIPDEATVDIQTPTYMQVHDQLVDVYNKVKAIPPGTTVNVGVISAEAIQKLQDVGMKVETLPDGTVAVTANTAQAARDLDAFVSRPRYAVVQTVMANGNIHVSGGNGPGGTQTRASGGPVWPGEPFLVGEKGPELVSFSQPGHVTPADQTAQIMAAMRQPAPSGQALAALGNATSSAVSSSSTVYDQRSRTIQVTVTNTRPMSERQLVDRLRDEEFLHGGY